MSTRDVIRYATVDGARVGGARCGDRIPRARHAGRHHRASDRPPNIFPINDPIGAVVWGMDTSNVDWVFVGGRVVMRDGVLEADVERAREPGEGGTARVAAASGLVVGAARGGRMSRPAAPSSALTSFVVASRYLPVYIAIAAPRRRGRDLGAGDACSAPASSSIAPFGTFLAITALGQMLVIMTGGIDLSVPGTLHARRASSRSASGRRRTSASGPPSASRSLAGGAGRAGQRDPDRRARAQRR